jgi:hypothetical protein
MSFPIEVAQARSRSGLAETTRPQSLRVPRGIRDRPACARAVERGGPYAIVQALTSGTPAALLHPPPFRAVRRFLQGYRGSLSRIQFLIVSWSAALR